ncbi:elongation factor G [Streptomyces vilmorinianum]|uniref:elongation factor G n=1 Tax=Streptomyces vilmorinianum TaxID=3051092 RepID=UPI0010FB8EA7|nr:TetM/TetW/TetO/TetS family tetracycline resistance ribosomal protection protein [Streptomyces vilmorinianum]
MSSSLEPNNLNLGILAHIDAGKTSLTERLLYAAGAIDAVGSVDEGSTQTDSLDLERQRGITIRSAVVSFAVDDIAVNLIDTPGHPDFIAEVERVLSVLDGAVLVVSAVEGVQAQTRVLMRTLRRLGIPTLIFVNKIDRRGADREGTLRGIREKLTSCVVPMGSTRALGTAAAAFTPYGPADTTFSSGLLDLLTAQDDAFLARCVENPQQISPERLRAELARQTAHVLAHPVFFGSAITGAGVTSLMAGVREFLPAVAGDSEGPVSGTVFTVERGTAGEKIAYVRMFSGTVRTRDTVQFRGGNGADHVAEGKVTGVDVFGHDAADGRGVARAGRIARLRGLGGIRVGDTISAPGEPAPVRDVQGHFAPPTLETVVVPERAADRGRLHVALTQLAEQDPLIDLRRDEPREETHLSLYGEVQKEVIQATLADAYGIGVTFRATTPLCVERLSRTGAAFEAIGGDGNPFLAAIGLRVAPAPPGSGVEFRLGIELGSLPLAFLNAVRETVDATLRQGVHGWRIPDCAVTLTRSRYLARQSHAHGTFDKSMSSTAGDFRHLTPLVLMSALLEAGTRVHEPVHRFRLEIPEGTLDTLLPVLTRAGALPGTTEQRGRSLVLEGDIPAARVHELQQRLPSLTQGEGVLESAFAHYRPVAGAVPTRARTDHNPLNRKEYLRHVLRRV